MSDGLQLDPSLAEVVAAVRQRARATGELGRPQAKPYASALSPASREAVTRWIRDGGYRAAVASVVADDPDLADQ